VDAFGLIPSSPVVKLGGEEHRLTRSRILVCAPSNAALDEIVLRVLRHGLLDAGGHKITPTIVRAGVAARMHASVSAVTLDVLTKQMAGESADFHEVCAPCPHAACYT
jgi:hypothetical protein